MVAQRSQSPRPDTSPRSTPSPFRVVAPSDTSATRASVANPSAAETTPPQASNPLAKPSDVPSTSPHRRLLIWGGVVCGLGAIGMIPIPYQVGGDVQLAWREEARQALHTPVPAIVNQVFVQPGTVVQPGQPLVQLSSRELEREIADVENQLAQVHQGLQQAQQAQIQAEASLLAAQAQEQATQAHVMPILNRVNQLEQGIMPPEMQQLQVEQQRLQGRLSEVQYEIERFESLVADGAIAPIRVDEQRVLYRDIERDLAVNRERMAQAQQELRDKASSEIGNLESQNTSVIAAQMIADSSAQITAQQQTIQMLERRLARLGQQQDALTLTATTSGTVITSDLDLLIGQEVQTDKTLLHIAELNQLTANVEIKEEDLAFVNMGAEVTFRPRQAKLEPYDARVDDILYNVEADETQQKRVATVRVVIDNPEKQLRPGSSGYAKIFSEWIPLYQRIGREVLKLIPERFLW